MTKAVFMRKRGQTVFDDVPWERYHFPKMYLAEAEQTVGDWIVYYETSRNRGRKSYFAIAYVRSIDDDPHKANHYYARLSDYVEFSSLGSVSALPTTRFTSLISSSPTERRSTINPCEARCASSPRSNSTPSCASASEGFSERRTTTTRARLVP